jgi:hypothetical protein
MVPKPASQALVVGTIEVLLKAFTEVAGLADVECLFGA